MQARPDAHRPLRSSSLLVQDLHDELLLVPGDGSSVHVLNATARHVWTLCDGDHTLEEIVHSLQQNFAVPPGTDLDHHVRGLLQDFAEKGLLQAAERG